MKPGVACLNEGLPIPAHTEMTTSASAMQILYRTCSKQWNAFAKFPHDGVKTMNRAVVSVCQQRFVWPRQACTSTRVITENPRLRHAPTAIQRATQFGTQPEQFEAIKGIASGEIDPKDRRNAAHHRYPVRAEEYWRRGALSTARISRLSSRST